MGGLLADPRPALPRLLPLRRHHVHRPRTGPGPRRRHPALLLPRHPRAHRRRHLRAEGRPRRGRRRRSAGRRHPRLLHRRLRVHRLAAEVRRQALLQRLRDLPHRHRRGPAGPARHRCAQRLSRSLPPTHGARTPAAGCRAPCAFPARLDRAAGQAGVSAS
ncbi:hypothetical protein SGPA1_21015 [Streptomyces misionensis JCM 4497]